MVVGPGTVGRLTGPPPTPRGPTPPVRSARPCARVRAIGAPGSRLGVLPVGERHGGREVACGGPGRREVRPRPRTTTASKPRVAPPAEVNALPAAGAVDPRVGRDAGAAGGVPLNETPVVEAARPDGVETVARPVVTLRPGHTPLPVVGGVDRPRELRYRGGERGVSRVDVRTGSGAGREHEILDVP